MKRGREFFLYFSPITLNISSCLYGYFESEWALCAYLHSEEGNTKRYTNFCKQMIHLSIYHTTLYFSTENHHLLVTITFQRLNSVPLNVLRVSGHCAHLHSEGNTLISVNHLSIYHTALSVTQGNLFNLHMIKGRTSA